MDKQRFYILAFMVWAAAACSNQYQGQKNRSDYSKLQGKNIPSDMVYISGTASLSPFYISKEPEPNICYMVYLQWLQKVHISNPIVFLEALPKKRDQNVNVNHFIEFTANPKYAFAPVTGLSWLQIQKYLHWKTDRLNESILQRKGFFENLNQEQRDDDNFNLEAFLHDQYEHPHLARKHHKKYQEVLQNVVNRYGLIMGYRLPTRQEFFCYSNKYSQTSIGKKDSRSSQIDKNYFLFQFSKALQPGNYSGKRSIYHPYNYPMDSLLKGHNRQGSRLHEASHKEWMLNDVEHPMADWLEAYQESGFNTLEGAILKDTNGLLLPKDSVGHLQSFRYLGIDENVNKIAVGLEPIQRFHEVHVSHELAWYYIEIPDSLKTPAEYITVPLYRDRLVCSTNGKDNGIPEVSEHNEAYGAGNIGFRCVLPYSP